MNLFIYFSFIELFYYIYIILRLLCIINGIYKKGYFY